MSTEKSHPNALGVATKKPLSPLWALLLVVAVASLRVLTNVLGAFNASPVPASATFSGARMRLWQALLVPIGVMVASDFALFAAFGWDASYSPWHSSRLWVYGCLLLNVVLGSFLVRSNNWWQILQIASASLLGSVLFFVITNLGAWLDPALGYSRDTAGLIDCYIMAIPFFRSSVVSDFLFTFGLFGIEALAAYLVQRKTVATVPTGVQG